jgi:hypothetical protein
VNEEQRRERLEALRKDANDPTLKAGDFVFCRGTYQKVRLIRTHAPGMHPHSPIRNDMSAREVVTDVGSRWRGIQGEGK